MALFTELSAESIIKNATEELVLIDKFVGDDLTTELSKLLESDTKVRRIVLRGNCIGTLGAQALANMLEKNTFIESLSLEWNQIGSIGAIALGAALMKNKKLHTLDLRNNNIADDGSLSLADVFRLNRTIKFLDLRWNMIGDKGATPFLDIVSREAFIVSIQLSGNLISSTMMAKLEGIVDKSNSDTNTMTTDGIAVQADAQSARRRSILLEKDVSELQQHLELSKVQREEVQRQLNASATKIVELEQQIIRDEYKNKQLLEDLDMSKRKITQIIDEQRIHSASWDTEREEISEQSKRIMREKEVEIRALTSECDGLRERCRKAEEETKRISFLKEQAAERSEAVKADLTNELRLSMDRNTEISTQKAALEHDNRYLKDLTERSNERIASLEEELNTFRTDASAKLKDEIIRAENEVTRLRLEHKKELDDLTELSTRQGKNIGELQSEVSELQARQASLHVEHRLELDTAVNDAKSAEQKRNKETITDLRQKVDAFMKFREELEARCAGYLNDYKELQDKTGKELQSTQDQLAFIQNENERLRLATKDLEDRLSRTTRERDSFESDLKDVTDKHEESSAERKKWHRIAEDAIAKNHKLTASESQLKRELKEAREARGSDFQLMSSRVSDAIRKEFEMLAVSLQKENISAQSL